MLHEVSFTSYNERDQVQGWIYVPACKPNGIVQLIHGFGEHSRRYIHMISAFLDAGYIVAADDHVGHGKTAMVNNVWGDWGDKGCHTMMEDEHTLKKIVCEKYPNLPYFLFGHSMGSFITRDFIAKYGNELNGATICGTTGIFRGAKEVKEKLKEIIDAGHGGSDSGATGNGMAEKNLTLAIVLAAKRSFDKDSRFQVSYTRTSDTYPSLSQRAKLANNKNADMFLCVHINSASASAHGTETLWSKSRNSATQKKGLTSKTLATAMQSAAVAATGFTNRGLVDRPNLYVLKHTNMPACLIEYGFISNRKESARMKANTSAYGKALYKAVVNLMKKQGKY